LKPVRSSLSLVASIAEAGDRLRHSFVEISPSAH
jgi:hypothetical protein